MLFTRVIPLLAPSVRFVDHWLHLVAIVSLASLLLVVVLGFWSVGLSASVLRLVMSSIISFFWGLVFVSMLGGVLVLLFLISVLFNGVFLDLGFGNELRVLPSLVALLVLAGAFLLWGALLLPLDELVVLFSLCSWVVLFALVLVSELLFPFWMFASIF